MSSTSAEAAQTRGYRVESPRASDAISSALRGVYTREMGLPEDMAALLNRLNRWDVRTAH